MDSEIKKTFAILGIQDPDSVTIDELNYNYINLVKLSHPDRLTKLDIENGWTKSKKEFLFQQIAEAYKVAMTYLNNKKYNNFPNQDINYSVNISVMNNVNNLGALNSANTNNMNINEFNNMFEELKKTNANNVNENSDNRGYEMFKRDENYARNIIASGVTYVPLHVEKTNETERDIISDNNDIITYDSINSKYFLLNEKTQDFSIQVNNTNTNSNSIYGADLMSVYGNNYIDWESNIKSKNKELFEKYNNKEDINKLFSRENSTRNL